MADSIIKVENLSKRFIISHEEQERYTSLRDVVTRKVKKTFSFGAKNTNRPSTREEFWALKDLNFEIKQGDRVGIIGRNGAGKSTLLKILSRITEPSSGKVTIDGRVASLLEVGTGFHPELTGRENIFLNGAILGMSRAEIKRKFDEIVAFAEVEKFLDTPVKRYSSGMYVRLAFAVAAHLEPEILIVDEVLAVGDAQFQKKCLGKMEDVSKNEGRTVLFVSHNLGTILQLCNKGILLGRGKLIINDIINKTVDCYLNENKIAGNIIDRIITNEDSTIQFSKIFMTNAEGEVKSEYSYDENVLVRIEISLPVFYDSLELAMRLIDKHERAVFTIHEKLEKHFNGHWIKLNIIIPQKFLTPGKYSWVVCVNHPGVRLYDLHENIASFTILELGSEFARYEGLDYGTVFAKYEVQEITDK
jgi:lipopolysaccharide transport system ATP-binding protein